MAITKEQEEHFKKMRKINETETIYQCEDCNAELIGLINVRQHISINNHYTYSKLGSKLIFGFV